MNAIDTKAHGDNPHTVIVKVRDWLMINSKRQGIPGTKLVSKEYKEFLRKLPVIVRKMNLDVKDLQMVDYTIIVEAFVKDKLSEA